MLDSAGSHLSQWTGPQPSPAAGALTHLAGAWLAARLGDLPQPSLLSSLPCLPALLSAPSPLPLPPRLFASITTGARECTQDSAQDSAQPSVQASRPESALESAQEHTRNALELHDAVSQTLFASNLLAGALARQPGADETVRGQAEVLERLNRCALANMRLMLFELHPEALASVPLRELLLQAVAALVGRGGVAAHTEIDDSRPLGASQRMAVYRVAQALLSNVARHSGASQVQLQWQAPRAGPALLRITDNGCGFDSQAALDGHAGHAAQPGPRGLAGLVKVRALAKALDAECSIHSAPGEGTEIILTLNRREKKP